MRTASSAIFALGRTQELFEVWRPLIKIPIDGARGERLSRELKCSCYLLGRMMCFEHPHHHAEKVTFHHANAFHRRNPHHMFLSAHFAHIISISAAMADNMTVDRARILAERTGYLGARVSGPQHTGNDRPIFFSNMGMCHTTDHMPAEIPVQLACKPLCS